MFALQWWRKRELRVIGASVLTLAKSGLIWTLGNTALSRNGSLDVAQCERPAFNGPVFRLGDSGEACRYKQLSNNELICDMWPNEWMILKKNDFFMYTSCTHRNVLVRFQYVKWIDQTLDDKNAERRRKSMGRLSEYLNCNDWHRFQFANHNCGEHILFPPSTVEGCCCCCCCVFSFWYWMMMFLLYCWIFILISMLSLTCRRKDIDIVDIAYHIDIANCCWYLRWSCCWCCCCWFPSSDSQVSGKRSLREQ